MSQGIEYFRSVFESLGEVSLKGFDEPVTLYVARG